MKKTFVFLVAFTLLCGASHAATTAATQTATPQQSRMKSCAAQYHQKGIAKSQYHAFMSQCLKGNAATAVVTHPKSAAEAPATPAQ